MSFPEHIAAILESYGVAPATKSALLDYYLQHGSAALDAFGDLAERFTCVAVITPEDLDPLKRMMVLRYVDRNHALWMAGKPTESFFAPRLSEGRGTGLVSPLGLVTEDGEGFASGLARAVRAIVGRDQPVPDGMLVMGRNAHYGGRDNTVSFDVVVPDHEDAVRVGLAEGRQHTVPGSIGETSGTFDGVRRIALLWEIQPNAYKPAGERNRKISKVFRRHRNWHVTTLTAAILWLRSAGTAVFVVKGEALAATHEVNSLEPVTDGVVDLHDRTLSRVAQGLGLRLREVSAGERVVIGESGLMNPGLRKRFDAEGAGACILALEE